MTYWKLSTIIILKYIFAEGKSVVRVPTLPKHLRTCFLSSQMSFEFTSNQGKHWAKHAHRMYPRPVRYHLATRGLSDYRELIIGEWRMNVESKPSWRHVLVLFEDLNIYVLRFAGKIPFAFKGVLFLWG